MGRKLAVDPRQIEHRCNRAHLVIVRPPLLKPERIKQLLLIALQPPHHGLPPPPNPSTSENHCSRQPSTDFCNKIGTKPDHRLITQTETTRLVGCARSPTAILHGLR